jgi:type II secretory pathway pseudopilin PulG
MGIKTETGFTIIETMLFLAVTGLLAVGILVGSGVSIGQQRYRDSVNSLKSYIQSQYSEVTNVVNGRASTWTCNSAANVSPVDVTVGQSRGTSDCVILGRYITVDAAGTTLATSNVVGYPQPGASQASSDIAELTTNYKLGLSPVDPSTTQVSWGAQIVKPKTTTPMPLAMLIMRSPLSGSVLTFIMITVGNMSQTQDICVNADAGAFVGGRMEVQVAAFAASQSAVQIPVESASVCN